MKLEELFEKHNPLIPLEISGINKTKSQKYPIRVLVNIKNYNLWIYIREDLVDKVKVENKNNKDYIYFRKRYIDFLERTLRKLEEIYNNDKRVIYRAIKQYTFIDERAV